ncbi:MAG TPA: copper chaperone PCu(A)C [Rhizomicrobium sp.]|jgi:hypothetical protein|nr:copper chaperone PCu(A)C [Rhizomicrobium sp.]
MLATPALAAGITVSHAALRVIAPGVPAAGYFDLRNDTAKPVVLIGARSPMCGAMMLHLSSSEGGMMRMTTVSELPVLPGAGVSFRPGSYHLMCEHPAPLLFDVHRETITLEFKSGAARDVTFTLVDAKGAPR